MITKESAPICHLCGNPIHGLDYFQETQTYCCEGCYLNDVRFHSSKIELDDTYITFAEALAKTLDIREHETGLHSKRVACHTMLLAKHYTDNHETLRQIYCGTLLHDIGKIGISDSVLLKAGSLTDDEWIEMRSHSEMGYSILSSIPLMKDAAEIVLSHEERYDGTGYPHGLKGKDIPLGTRIFAVIDTLDAITSDRAYRKGASFEVAKDKILSMASTQFDLAVVSVFVEEEFALREMVNLKCGVTPLGIYNK